MKKKIYLVLICLLFFQTTLSYSDISNNQLPTGANIVSGNITINQEPGKLTINQTSAQGIIEWKAFNLGSNAFVFFNHNNATDTLLNQVRDIHQSTILGKIYSNGKLFINNPNGISLGANASINAQTFIASAMNLANRDFLNRNYHFTQDRVATIENLGDIKAQYVALMAPEVTNKGVITSKNGATHLAASDAMTLTINQDQTINIKINPSKIKASAGNEGVIISENGVVKIRADMAEDAIAATIKAPDNQAVGLVSKNGVIKLVSNTGTIKAKQVTLDAGARGAVVSSGNIDTSSSTAKGGSIELIGKEVILKSGSVIQSKGVNQGGNIYIGKPILLENTANSSFVTLEQNSLIDVSSLYESAGVVEIRSGQSSEERGRGTGSMMSLDGIIMARTGGSRRNGLAEVIISGYDVNLDQIYIDASSNIDIGGNILVEAYNDIVGGKISLISNGKIEGGGINVVSLFGEVNLQQSLIQTNSSAGKGGTIMLNSSQNITLIDANINARGSPAGGNINIISLENSINLQSSIIQTNGSTGRGGTIQISGLNSTFLDSSIINAQGLLYGGNIYVGNNLTSGLIPFTASLFINSSSALNANQISVNDPLSKGGFIETSGRFIVEPFAQINSGMGGEWLIDPNGISIGTNMAGKI